MLTKVIKYVVVPVVVVGAVGGVLFGTDLGSYVSSSARSIRHSVKESVPLDFELQRARDLLEDIVPEMHANIRLIAREEVEVENLKRDIAECEGALADERAKIRRLSGMLEERQDVYRIGGRRYDRQDVKGDLARRFERFKEAEVVLAGKRKLLAAREKSLTGAVRMLEKARGQKALLADRIESLAAQHRLVQAASVGSKFQLENSKLAQTSELIGEIKKRLDVAERVLAREGQFVEEIEVDVIDEADLLTQVHRHLDGEPEQGPTTPTEPSEALAAEEAPAAVAGDEIN